MSRIEPACNLDNTGMQPIDFINPTVVPQVYIDEIQKNISRIYGCIQIPQASESWFCTTNETEKVLYGHVNHCATNLVESDCGQNSQRLISNMVQVIVNGCILDSKSSAFYCQPNSTTKVNCTIKSIPATTSSGLSVAVPVVVTLVAIAILALGILLWFRNRRKSKSVEEPVSPKATAPAAQSGINIRGGRPSNASSLNNTSVYAAELGRLSISPNNPSTAAAVASGISPHAINSEQNKLVERPRKKEMEQDAELQELQEAFMETAMQTNQSSSNSSISLVAPRTSMNFDTALPSLNETARNSSHQHTAQPRPYRSFVNIQGQALDDSDIAGAVPKLHTTLVSLPRQATIAPPKEIAQMYLLDWKLPLSIVHRTEFANALVKSKVHLPDYSIQHLVTSFENFQKTLGEIITASFHYAHELNQPNLASKIFHTTTGMHPRPEDGMRPNESAFLSKVIHILLSDVFIALTSPMKLPDHLAFLKKQMKELKPELKFQPTTQLLFCAFDQILTANSNLLLEHLHPLMAHAANSVSALFSSHGLPPPDKLTLDHFLQAEVDWFIRIKREFPTVAVYVPHPDAPLQPYIVAQGGEGRRVAFVTCLGLWDISVGQPGYLARVWAKA